MASKQGDWRMVRSMLKKLEKRRQAVTDPEPRRESVPKGHVRYRYQVYAHDYAVPAAMFLRRSDAFSYARSVTRHGGEIATVVDVDRSRAWHVEHVVTEAELG